MRLATRFGKNSSLPARRGSYLGMLSIYNGVMFI